MARRKRGGRSNAIAVPAPADQRESINVRAIKNGFLIERSGTRRGKYFSETEFSPGRPVISAATPKPTAKAASRPRAARPGADEVGYLRGH